MVAGSDGGEGRTPASSDRAAHTIVHIALDEKSFIRRRPEVEHEREVALFDLLERNHFELVDENAAAGPYHLTLSLQDDRLVFDIRTADGTEVRTIALPMRPFRATIRDYFLVCETYFDAIKTQTPSQIEAIDMGRRGLHNDGALMLKERLATDVTLDHTTARRFFTLLCVLHMRG